MSATPRPLFADGCPGCGLDPGMIYTAGFCEHCGWSRRWAEAEAYRACHALGCPPAELEPRVRRLVEALRDRLPVNSAGTCLFCGLGGPPETPFIHFDGDNLWDGDQERCLQHPDYDQARAALADWGAL